MRAVVNPRGRLPARVYWFRRSLLLLTALALVFPIGRLLNGSGQAAPGEAAQVSASSPSAPAPSTTTPPQAVVGPLPVQSGPGGAGTPGAQALLAVPNGPCAIDEITVTPTISTAVAGGRVDLTVDLTGIKPACTFTVSPRTLVAKISSGADRIWSSQDCPTAISTTSVVVRSAAPTTLHLSWSGRRSDAECSRSTAWALPGYYHLTAAAIGSEPTEAQFKLTSPPRPVVTKTARPHKVKKKAGAGTACGGDNAATSC